MQNFTITVTEDEANLIIKGLQELPHKVSNNLIGKLVTQGTEQAEAFKKAREKEEKKGKE